MTIPLRLAGPTILAMAFAANALHNIPGFYPVVFFIGIGVVLPALALGRTVRGEPSAARPLGVALGWRDALAVLAALAIGCALAAKPLGPIVAQPGGMERIATLFAQLLVASTAEVLLFLGATGLALRALLGGRHDWRFGVLLVVVSSLLFGLFHFTYPTPWNTLANATTVTVVWIGVSTLFAVTRSLVAAILLDNMMATVGFATRDLTLPLASARSLLLALLAVAAFAAAFAWARRASTAASPSPVPR
ncbi:MAG: hypothetical protein K2X72_11530 [Reyranella sp.]|nr:hypothetical protein [Reyranella sp.]